MAGGVTDTDDEDDDDVLGAAYADADVLADALTAVGLSSCAGIATDGNDDTAGKLLAVDGSLSGWFLVEHRLVSFYEMAVSWLVGWLA